MKQASKIANLSLQGALYYKASFFMNILSPFLLLIGQFALWVALFNMNEGSIGGYTRNEMYSHLILSFIIQNALTWSSETTVSREIRSGNIVYRCLRPVSFLLQSISDVVGKMIPQLIVNFSFVIIAFIGFSSYLITPKLISTLLAILSMFLGLFLRITMVSTVSLLTFFTTSHLGISWTRQAITDFFSGAVVPVVMFPVWLKTIANFSPFPYMLQVPITIFMGKELPTPLPITFLVQILWTVIFVIIHELLYKKARQNLSVAGG